MGVSKRKNLYLFVIFMEYTIESFQILIYINIRKKKLGNDFGYREISCCYNKNKKRKSVILYYF